MVYKSERLLIYKIKTIALCEDFISTYGCAEWWLLCGSSTEVYSDHWFAYILNMTRQEAIVLALLFFS